MQLYGSCAPTLDNWASSSASAWLAKSSVCLQLSGAVTPSTSALPDVLYGGGFVRSCSRLPHAIVSAIFTMSTQFCCVKRCHLAHLFICFSLHLFLCLHLLLLLHALLSCFCSVSACLLLHLHLHLYLLLCSLSLVHQHLRLHLHLLLRVHVSSAPTLRVWLRSHTRPGPCQGRVQLSQSLRTYLSFPLRSARCIPLGPAAQRSGIGT